MMNMPTLSISGRSIAAFFALTAQTDAFSSTQIVHHHHTPTSSHCHASASTYSTSLNLQQQPFSDRHFQLEELEDAETSTTDVLLNSDLTVSLGETDGPLYTAAEGTWSEDCEYMSVSDDDYDQSTLDVENNLKRSFTMKLARTFVTGVEKAEASTDIGEIKYSVERTYKGECTLVGGSVFAMNGEILDVDEIFGDRRVGFFNMIDATEERENNAMGV
eukprot:CAMPEP_0172297512 /NCGR_PEP_ID=MMETSP1058-20130122/505_1 /TAXON_ID=83371 /ORGANISM="Detonula confervacea, Strain CCMP 353" /LENGTH=217 /DNA_ID=CAMNT_0013006673 /DNA_START=120 /DNA_END=773 /DNA_ORIENTATION=+